MHKFNSDKYNCNSDTPPKGSYYLGRARVLHIDINTSKMTEETDFPKEIDDNKNKNTIRCQFCDSIILKARSASYSENEVS